MFGYGIQHFKGDTMERLTNLSTDKIGKKLWRLTSPLLFCLKRLDTETTGKPTHPVGVLQIPKNFITDGASAPWMTWSLCPPMGGAHAEAAVLHDYLYSKDSDDVYEVDRKMADEIFYDTMIENGTKKFRAKAIYYAVRLGGGGSYKACHSVEKVKE